MLIRLAFFLLLAAIASAPAAAAPRLSTLDFPGHPQFVKVERDVLDVRYAIDGSQASQAGLADDASHAPSYTPAAIASDVKRLRADMAAMRKLPWRSYSVDEQIDIRYTYALAQDDVRALTAEKLYVHRPGQWVESLANNYINLLTYSPERRDVREKLTAQIPAMVAEMRKYCTSPTNRDVLTTPGIIDGMLKMLANERATPQRAAAVASLKSYNAYLKTLHPSTDYAVIGADNYAWRLKHVSLLPWTPAQLLAIAKSELVTVDKQTAALKPKVVDPNPTPQQVRLAKSLDQARLLSLYNTIEKQHFATLRKLNIITVPAGVGPIVARVTPDAQLPFGDGGSMNPPATYSASNVGFWNVEHFHPSMKLQDRIADVLDAQEFNLTGMGPYSVHEGVPGHHLQLSIARLNKDPLRSIASDAVQNEGWALYAEQEFWQAGGLGNSVNAHYNTLRSWRHRVKRVIYDVNVETNAWTLQQGADFAQDVAAGKGKIEGDIARTYNWPSQLICYFAGKEQILSLKAAYKKKMGKRYSERLFNDRLLSLGSVPYVFARAKMLGEPVPDFD